MRFIHKNEYIPGCNTKNGALLRKENSIFIPSTGTASLSYLVIYLTARDTVCTINPHILLKKDLFHY